MNCWYLQSTIPPTEISHLVESQFVPFQNCDQWIVLPFRRKMQFGTNEKELGKLPSS